MASNSTYYEKRIPLKADKFKFTFPKFKLTSYHDTTTPVPRTTNTAILAAQHIRTLSWSPLGNLVATGSGNAKIRVWNPERANVKHSTELRGHTTSIERVAWNPVREAELATLSVDGSVRIWDVRSNKNVAQMKIADKEGFSLCWKPDGTEMLVGTKDDNLVRISRETVTEISRHSQGIQTNHSTFSHSGRELFLTTGDGSIRILDYPSMSALYSFKAHTSSSFCIELSPNAKTLAVGGTDALLTLWDTTDWFCRKAVGNLNGPVRTLSFSWCGGYIVSGGEEDKVVRVTHVASGEEIKEIPTGPAPMVQWSPRDYALAYAVHEKGGGLRIYSPPANIS